VRKLTVTPYSHEYSIAYMDDVITTADPLECTLCTLLTFIQLTVNKAII